MATTHEGTSGTQRSTHGMQAGTPDTTYDLISVMYHTLQGCQTYEQYAQDAEQGGQKDAAQFFRDAGREFERLAQRGQQLLAQCLQQGQGGRSQLSSQNAGSQSQRSGDSLQQQQSGSSSQAQQSGSMSRAQQSGSLSSGSSLTSGSVTGGRGSGSSSR